MARRVILVGHYECVLHDIPDLRASQLMMLVQHDDTRDGNALQLIELPYTSLGHVPLHSIEEV